MTPVEIEVLMWYYTRPTDWTTTGDANFWHEMMARLQSYKLLEPDASRKVGEPMYRLAPRGHAYVEALKAMPLPHLVASWVVSEFSYAHNATAEVNS